MIFFVSSQFFYLSKLCPHPKCILFPTQNLWIWTGLHEAWASQVALVVKNLPVSAGDIRDVGSIPGWEDPLEEGMAIHFSGLLQSIESKSIRHERLK